jgi:hypothetical protein
MVQVNFRVEQGSVRFQPVMKQVLQKLFEPWLVAQSVDSLPYKQKVASLKSSDIKCSDCSFPKHSGMTGLTDVNLKTEVPCHSRL